MVVLRRVVVPLLTLLSALLFAGSSARAQGQGRGRSPRASSLSAGFANNGALARGRHLPPSDTIRYLPGRPLHWGTEELVGLVERVARDLHRSYGFRLTVGDLSAQHGGPVSRHRSHQSGRDVDLPFFMRIALPNGRSGRPVEPVDYVSFDRRGVSLDGRYAFDTARNWAVLQRLLSDRVRVERVFVSSPLRAMLLSYGRSHGASTVASRAAQVMVQPARVSPHDNHFHARIACPSTDPACREGVWLRRRPPRHRHGARPRRASTTR